MRGWGDLRGLDLTTVDPACFVRFWKKVDKEGPRFERSRCWIWVGGSGTKSQNRKTPTWMVPGLGVKMASQVCYALEHGGVLPPNRILKKLCGTHRCIRHFEAVTTGEASRRIQRETSPIPVDEIRRRREAGATCAQLAEEFGEFGHERVRLVALNRTFADPPYDAQKGSVREEHPELVRFSAETIDEIRKEVAAGVSLLKISKWLKAPYATVWEAVNGPSGIARRKAAA